MEVQQQHTVTFNGHAGKQCAATGAHAFVQRLIKATYHKAGDFKQHVPSSELIGLLDKGSALLKQEPTLLELTLEPDCRAVMVGDTHGQLHDVVHMMELMGPPSPNQLYIFNGDFVDRGAWGVELLAFLVALKLEYRTRVYLLRGNHEGSTCTKFYGFKGELDAKYGGAEAKAVYAACKHVFSQLPLAALVQGKTLVLHGGLFRYVTPPEPRGLKNKGGFKAKKRRLAPVDPLAPMRVGDLDVLRGSNKGGVDPDGRGTSVVAADVLWSDPVRDPGLQENEQRGVGLTFGPDVTQAFLEANGLRLILRSHEGPDARDRRDDMPQVTEGYSVDHDTSAGRLMTVFSAPDYPQFMSAHEARYANKGAVAVLSGPTWHEPSMVSYEAVKPRPEAVAFYDYETYPDTDDELMAAELGEAASQGGSARDLAISSPHGGCEVTSTSQPHTDEFPERAADLHRPEAVGAVSSLLAHTAMESSLIAVSAATPPVPVPIQQKTPSSYAAAVKGGPPFEEHVGHSLPPMHGAHTLPEQHGQQNGSHQHQPEQHQQHQERQQKQLVLSREMQLQLLQILQPSQGCHPEQQQQQQQQQQQLHGHVIVALQATIQTQPQEQKDQGVLDGSPQCGSGQQQHEGPGP